MAVYVTGVHGTEDGPGDRAILETSETEIDPDTSDLLASLRGPAEDGLNTFLVLDPVRRKAVTGVFDLDGADVPLQSLFEGRAAEEAAETAPYLADLTVAPDEPPSRFTTGFLKAHWGRDTGLLIRSRGSFAEVRRHLRRFTKLRREADGRWFFFRFWDPLVAGRYFRTISESERRAEQWFGRGLIDSFIVEEEAGKTATCFRPAQLPEHANRPLGPVVLKEWELRPFRTNAFDRDVERMARNLKGDFGPELKHYPEGAVARLIRPVLERFTALGFRRKEHLHVIAAWSLFYGPGFIEMDREGELARICAADAPERERFAAMKARMEGFGAPEEVQ
ncbi:DUF4123 domain-containing protein [Oceanicola sp. D3]|uniref:DUF4123 domain-containing protein n=1 Tax=Oceanicola sp. D3 TaxID=2587163 RepID=UPI00143E0B79|nr:DUF4123 domain-containing protein [Oceanicola sp. D3]